MPEIPKAFIEHKKAKYVLFDTIDDFGYEEQQAIHSFYITSLPIEEISKVVELSENHVLSVIVLYAERLTSKLDIFKKVLPYNVDDMLQVSEILLQNPEREVN